MDVLTIREGLRELGLDAWVLWDFRGSNPVLWDVLGVPATHTTRRLVLVVPVEGEPALLVSVLDRHLVTGPVVEYNGRAEFEALLQRHVPRGRVAMEYSPHNRLPIVACADAGAVEVVRSLAGEVVSSGDLHQLVAAAWDADAVASHHEAVRHVMELHELGRALAQGATEASVTARLVEEIARRGLVTDHDPAVAVGPHAGNPHHTATDTVIGPDQILLLDIWARLDRPRTVFGDVTWMSYTGSEPPEAARRALAAVAAGRDAALALLDGGTERRGFELDRAAREAIAAAGYGDRILHRTGHSLDPSGHVHGLGANLDDFETHDDRRLLGGTGFTVEPGVYGPDFGVRLECNVFLDPARGAQVTTPLQTEFTCLQWTA